MTQLYLANKIEIEFQKGFIFVTICNVEDRFYILILCLKKYKLSFLKNLFYLLLINVLIDLCYTQFIQIL